MIYYINVIFIGVYATNCGHFFTFYLNSLNIKV